MRNLFPNGNPAIFKINLNLYSDSDQTDYQWPSLITLL